MRRDQVTEIFKDATKEQIDQILDINSADISRAMGTAGNAQKELDAAHKTRAELQAKADQADKLQQEVDRLNAAEQQRKEAEKQAQERAELEERFGAVSGEKKYIHERMREIVLDDFGKALADKANRGKGDKEIFDAITKDKGYFSSENPPAKMGGVENITGSDNDQLSDAEYYAKVFGNK